MKFENNSFKKQKKFSDKFSFELGKEGQKLNTKEISVEKKMSSYFLQNDKGSTESIKPHLTEKKDFDKSMKNINSGAFKA